MHILTKYLEFQQQGDSWVYWESVQESVESDAESVAVAVAVAVPLNPYFWPRLLYSTKFRPPNDVLQDFLSQHLVLENRSNIKKRGHNIMK